MTMKKKDIIEGKIIKTEFPNKGTFICEDQKVTVKGVIDEANQQALWKPL